MSDEAAPIADLPDTTHARLGEIFVELADTLVDDFDFTDLMHNLAQYAVELLDVSAAGVMLGNKDGRLVLVASSQESARLLELYELQTSQGPCIESFESGDPQVNVGVADAARRWPAFSAACLDAGFPFVHALPLRLRDQTIGAINLFSATTARLSPPDVKLGAALSAVATIGILQQRSIQEKDLLSTQLQTALNSRVIIEQAKGVISERNGLTPDRAFHVLRSYARANGKAMAVAAGEVLDGTWNARTSR